MSYNKNKVIESKNQIAITKKDTLIILDWDNTLFPTTWVMKNNIDLNDPEIRNKYITYFSDLDDMLYKLLKKLQEYGKVIIVTNALPIWVKISSSVLPKTSYLLRNLKIVSARKIYKPKSEDMMDWKKMAFKNEIFSEMANNKILNIISVGDADYEYKALIDLYKLSHNSKKILKSVKLMEDPSHETLLDQLDVLYKAIHDVCLSKNHLDLKFKYFSTYKYN